MNRQRLSRTGFTLVELLVVIGILLALAGLGILFLPGVQQSQPAARGPPAVQGALLIAKQRAVRDQGPRGLRLIIDDVNVGYVIKLQYIEQPDDFSGGVLTTHPPAMPATPPPFTQVMLTGVDLWNGDNGSDKTRWHVLEGDYLEIFGGGQTYRIKTVTSNGPDSGLILHGPADTPPGAGIATAITEGTKNYRIIRTPRITGEDVIQLPDNVAIDLNTNWLPPPPSGPPNGYSQLNPLPKTPANAPSIDILFAPSGRLLYPAPPGDLV